MDFHLHLIFTDMHCNAHNLGFRIRTMKSVEFACDTWHRNNFKPKPWEFPSNMKKSNELYRSRSSKKLGFSCISVPIILRIQRKKFNWSNRVTEGEIKYFAFSNHTIHSLCKVNRQNGNMFLLHSIRTTFRPTNRQRYNSYCTVLYLHSSQFQSSIFCSAQMID